MEKTKMMKDSLLQNRDLLVKCTNYTLDIATNKIEDHYSNAENIFNDIFFFSTEHLQNQNIPVPNSFNYIYNWISEFNIDNQNLSTEYQLFASSFNSLMQDGPEKVDETSA